MRVRLATVHDSKMHATVRIISRGGRIIEAQVTLQSVCCTNHSGQYVFNSAFYNDPLTTGQRNCDDTANDSRNARNVSSVLECATYNSVEV